MDIAIRHLGRREYAETLRAMQDFTAARTAASADEIWLLEHPPVYTMGFKGGQRVFAPIGESATAPAHMTRRTSEASRASVSARGPRLGPIGGIPVVQSDRGGDMTYHGPGQLVAYLLIDIQRRGLGIRALVRLIEQAVIDLLATHGVAGERRAGAPGVYVRGAKIAALGLRVRNGATYHGLSLNVDMDLTPFGAIDPCGYPGLAVTQLRDLNILMDMQTAGAALARGLVRLLGYTGAREPQGLPDTHHPTGTHG
jgi:lipoyl(octanoyl) transferase